MSVLKKICIPILAFAAVCAASLKIDDSGFVFVGSRSFLMLPLFALVLYGLKSIFTAPERRLMIFSVCPALILSVFHLLGLSLVKKGSALWLLRDVRTVLIAILLLVGYTTLQFVLIWFLIRFINDRLEKSSPQAHSLLKKRWFFMIWAVLFLSRLPVFLNQFPAIMTADTIDQFEMVLGIEPLSDHHPFFYTLLLKGAVSVSRLFCGAAMPADQVNQTAAALFIVVQMLFMTAVCSAVIWLLMKSISDKTFAAAAFVFYLLYPVNAMYSITMWKDVPFAVCLLAVLALLFCELRMHKPLYCILLGIFGVLLVLFRHNGFYIVLLTLPFIPFAFPHRAKPVLLTFLVILLFYGCWSRILLPALNVRPGSISEAFSIPLQQIALTAKRQHPVMDEKLLSEIRYYFDEKDIWEQYTYKISDPVKNRFNSEKYTAEPMRFWKLWLKLCETYPQDFVDGFLLHSYGYWYPETPHWVFLSGIDNDGMFGIHSDPKLSNSQLDRMWTWLKEAEYDELPLLSLLFSPGACFWVYLILFTALLYRKQKSFILCIPVFILWLTAVASPVNCEFRYVYGMFLALPIVSGGLTISEKR